MLIKNAILFYGTQMISADIKIVGAHIEAVGAGFKEEDNVVLDCAELYVLPGLVDIHTHGIGGFDFSTATPEQLILMRNAYLKQGTTTVLATLVPMEKSSYSTQINKIMEHDTVVHGIHMEGPFLNQDKKGALNPHMLQAVDVEFLKELRTTAGEDAIKRMTAAPELDADNQLKQYAGGKFSLSAGHTNADYETAHNAFANGFDSVTHMYNAMPQFHHRNSGVIGAALEIPVLKELICDGSHLDNGVIKSMLRGFPNEVVLVSDSIAACTLSDGDYVLGALQVQVQNGVARLADGTLAGSTSTLLDCIRYCVNIGCDPVTAVRCATEIPAKAIGLQWAGRIAPGLVADLLIVDSQFRLVSVIKHGEIFQ